MKLLHEMTAVELLSEFCRKREYHETVAEARAWMASNETPDYARTPRDRRGAVLVLKRPGQRHSEVREPGPGQDERWAELCAMINRRFDALRGMTT